MPTMQNRTKNALAVTCNDSRFISGFWRVLGLREPMRFPFLSLSSVRIWLLTSWPVPKVWRKTYRLTNAGMLMILCLDVAELLDNILIDSRDNFFFPCQPQF